MGPDRIQPIWLGKAPAFGDVNGLAEGVECQAVWADGVEPDGADPYP
jgi:hypothetical protein